MPPTNSARFTLPEGGAARLYSMHHAPGFPWAVLAASNPALARPEAFGMRGAVSAVLTHDEGMTWPNARGEALAVAILDEGGAVALAFRNIADALACKRRLEGAAR